jgi:aminoglycoside 6'-N-acetyltransferase I
MNVELKLTDRADAYIIKNLWPLYVNNLSEFDGRLPNKHGMTGAGSDIASYFDLEGTLDGWWEHPEGIFPYLIYADGLPAGFNIIASPPFIPRETEKDFIVEDFFVLHCFRGQGVAEAAMQMGFDRHRGEWEIATFPNSSRAVGFWKKVLGSNGDGVYTVTRGEHARGDRVIFQFDNSETKAA